MRIGQQEDLAMHQRLVSGPARPAARAFAVAAATTLFSALIGVAAVAQTPPAPPAPPAAPAPKAKAAPKAHPKPAEAPTPQAQAQPAAPPAAAGEQPQLIFSPWTKFCLKGQEANAKQVCFTGKDGRVES